MSSFDPAAPFFSVVIPTYNRADLIGATIDSLLNQSFKNFEIVVVDDESTDNTEAVVASINDEHRQLRYFSKTNGERGAARNFGADKSLGKYLNFFDSDDLAYPNHFENAYRKITQLNYPEFYYQQGEIRTRSGELKTKVFLPKDPARAILKENFLLPNGVFLSKRAFSSCKYSENRQLSGSEDGLLYILLFMKYPFYNDITVTHSLIEHGGRSVNLNNVTLESLVGRSQMFVSELRSNEMFMHKFGEKVLRNIELAFYQHIAIQMAAKGDFRSAFFYWKQTVVRKYSTLFSKTTIDVFKQLILKKVWQRSASL